MNVTRRIQLLKRWLGMGLIGWMTVLPLTAIAIEFRPPRRSIPGRREGAGTRGPACVEGKSNLTILLPQTNLGYTTAAYPRFFWFVPQTRAQSMQFTLFRGTEEDPEQQIIYEKTLTPSATAGIVSLALPANGSIAPLTVGQDYYWTVTLLCHPDEPSKNIQVEGWIQRIPLDPVLAQKLTTANPSDRPQLYAAHGLWFDTLSTLAALRCTDTPTAASQQSWASLLRSVQLDRLADQPLPQSCQ
ncbi:MAG: DUF928 domain-containing protein [Leptolyngbyaceae cyanobacterium bins.349]|nr:DUF928 domain-containing protein [Leptolyngbyaceae cyanobacterium bins.349]